MIALPLIRRIHHARVHTRRVGILAAHLSARIPRKSSVLDIGAGDGLLAAQVLEQRPDLRWVAVDTLARPTSHVPVQLFDGVHLPFADRTFDVAVFVDVLHHTDDPLVLLREAVRVARCLVIKDHLCEGAFAAATLRFMDWVSNAGWGVRLPYNYWTASEWNEAWRSLELRPVEFERALRLYPWWADWLFGRSLHFVSRLEPRGAPRV